MKYFLAFAFLIQLPLALNTGYFSHDELQWLARADTDSILQIPWEHWSDFTAFQYRPLTFNLWLLLSYFFGYKPILMHSAQAVLGIMNALLLRQVLINFGLQTRQASIGALAFLLTPFVIFTHSWIGTFADQLYLAWLLFALLWICNHSEPAQNKLQFYHTPVMVAAFTSLALLSKEAAVIFPCLMLSAAYRVRARALLPSFLASSIVVAIYLALRLNIILFAPRSPGVYTWAISNIPARLVEYSVFPFVQNLHEIVSFPWWDKDQVAVATVAMVILLISIAGAGLRWLIALIVLWIIALGPVLILSTGSNQYAYTASAFICGLFVLAYPHIKPWSKSLLIIACTAALLHSIDLARYMRRIGRMQQHLYTDLMPLLPTVNSDDPLRIRASNAEDESILRHLTYAIPTYHRQPFSPRIQVVPSNNSTTQSTHLMLHNGALVPNLEHSYP